MGDTTLSAMGYPVFNDNHSKQETPESTEWSYPLIKVVISGGKGLNQWNISNSRDVGVNTRQAVGKLAHRPLFTGDFLDAWQSLWWHPPDRPSPSYQAPTVHKPRNNPKVTHSQCQTTSGKQSLVKASLSKQFS